MDGRQIREFRSEKHISLMECLERSKGKSKEEVFAELDSLLVPVMSSAKEVLDFLESQPADKVTILYFMYKDLEECYMSTSRIHINNLWPNAVYLPCNISPENKEEIEKIYEIADSRENVVFINHTAPHKSNELMRRRYGDSFGDYLVKTSGKFSIVEGNGDAFVEMSSDMLGTDDFSNITVIIVGVGGAGVLALLAIKEKKPKRIILVDLVDKTDLAKSVGAEFYKDISEVKIENTSSDDRLVIIDATTHHNKRDEKAFASDFVKENDSEGNIFIDYNMFVDPREYNDLSTKCAIGSEYVAYTNYIMALKIIEASKDYGVTLAPVSKDEFDEIVVNSIDVRNKIETIISAN